MVTAALPPFARQCSRVDVAVSALGDAKSLRGGILRVTPLYGADGEIYAVSQGPLTVGGFSAEGAAETVTQGVPTSARISAGAIVEREVDFALDQLASVRIALRNPDFTTGRRIAQAINGHLSRPSGPRHQSVDRRARGAVVLPRPDRRAAYRDRAAAGPARPAGAHRDRRALRHHRDGRGGAHQPGRGRKAISPCGSPRRRRSPSPIRSPVPRTRVEIEESGDSMVLLEEGVSLEDLVAGLNALGVGPRDLIGILQAIKAARALQAEIMVM
jgi:flagellar P-ring protein precursor FlgI